MLMEPPISSSADPLARYSALALFPQTLPAYRAPEDAEDMESLHVYLKSKALVSPQKHLEQAMSIVKNSPEFFNPKNSKIMSSEDDNLHSADGPGSKDNAKIRRPALGRKKAQFSLIVEDSQDDGKHEPSLDIDHLQDPEEYFMAYERLENAKKELQKQRGNAVMDLDGHEPVMTARRRRPGTLGRKVSYKHMYSSVTSDNDASRLSSQNMVEEASLNKANNILLQESSSRNVEPNDVEAIEEDRVDGLLDELLPGKHRDLNVMSAASFVRDRLQIKSNDADKFRLPEMDDIWRRSSIVSGEKLNLPGSRVVLSDMQNILKGPSNNTTIKYKQTPDISIAQSSNTPPKSPFSKLSLLRKLVLKVNTSSDPFSVSNIEPSPEKSLSRDGASDQFDPIDTAEDFIISGKNNLLVDKKYEMSPSSIDTSLVRKSVSSTVITSQPNLNETSEIMDISRERHFHSNEHDAIASADARATDNMVRNQIADVTFSESQHDVRINDEVFSAKEAVIESNSAVTDANSGSQAFIPAEINDKITGIPEACADSVQSLEIKDSTIEELNGHNGCTDQLNHVADETTTEGPLQNANTTADLHDMVASDPSRNDVKKKGTKRVRRRKEHSEIQEATDPGQSSPVTVPVITEHVSSSPLPSEAEYDQEPPITNAKEKRGKRVRRGKQPSQTKSLLPGQPSPIKDQAMVDDGSSIPLSIEDGHNKAENNKPPRRDRKREGLSERQSLAGAGIKWESGVRKSTRIRMRPLQYWKGERFLYGRLHESLATVIGVKYVSPEDDNDGKLILKVESYVSDEYKELVELAACH